MMVTARSIDNYQVQVTAGEHTFASDEPEIIGGDDTGPNPYQLLLGALASCKIITCIMYAQRKGWPLEGVRVRLDTRRVYARDCEACESDPDAQIDLIEGEIAFEGDLTGEQLERLHEIAGRCPVHRTLTSETRIETVLAQPA